MSEAKKGDIFIHRTRNARRTYLMLADEYDSTKPYAVLLEATDRADWAPRDINPSRSVVGFNYGSRWELDLTEGPESFFENSDVIAEAGSIHVDLEQNFMLSVHEREDHFGTTFDIDLQTFEHRNGRAYTSIPFSRWRIWHSDSDRKVDAPLFERRPTKA